MPLTDREILDQARRSGSYGTSLSRSDEQMILAQARTNEQLALLAPEQLAQYNSARVSNPRGVTSGELGSLTQSEVLTQFGNERKNAEAQQKIDALYNSPEVQIPAAALKANRNDRDAFFALQKALVNTPLNSFYSGNSSGDLSRSQAGTAKSSNDPLFDFNPLLDFAAKNPDVGFGEAQAIHDPGTHKSSVLKNGLSLFAAMASLGTGLGLAAGNPLLGGLAAGSTLGGVSTGAGGVGLGAGGLAAPAAGGYANALANTLAANPGLTTGAASFGATSPISALSNLPTPPISQPPNLPAPTGLPNIPPAPSPLALGATGAIGAGASAVDSLIPGISNDALLNAGGALASGVTGVLAAGKSADQQAQGAQAAIDLQREMYNQNRADIAPWREAGVENLTSLQAQMPELTRSFSLADFQADPGTQFREEQGRQELQNYLGQTGQIQSGAAQQEAMRFGQGLAAQDYGQAYNRYVQNQGNTFNRLASMAGVGQTATQQLGKYGQNMATNVGSNLTSQAAARATGTMGQANALSGAIGQGLSMYNTNKANQQSLNQSNQWLDWLRSK